jgi:hypothetical protein
MSRYSLGCDLNRSTPLTENTAHSQTGVFLCLVRAVIASLEHEICFIYTLSKPLFCSSNTRWPAKYNGSESEFAMMCEPGAYRR